MAIQVSLTKREELFLAKLKAIMPKRFLDSCTVEAERNLRLLGMAGLALADINNEQPRTSFTIANFPEFQLDFLCFATLTWITMLKRLEFSLIDVQYSDGGFSINVDRVGKIGAAFDTLEKTYNKQVVNFKNSILLSGRGRGLGTPRFQSNLSRFISILGNGAFGWNIP